MSIDAFYTNTVILQTDDEGQVKWHQADMDSAGPDQTENVQPDPGQLHLYLLEDTFSLGRCSIHCIVQTNICWKRHV